MVPVLRNGLPRRSSNRCLLICAFAIIAAAADVPTATARGASTTAHKVFYLDALKHHCYTAQSSSSEQFTAVPCSNPNHDLEVYWTGHGGWGRSNPPEANRSADARSTCISRYEQINNGRYKSYSFFFADPGAQHRKYHDHTVCAHSTNPKLKPLGAGWHVTG